MQLGMQFGLKAQGTRTYSSLKRFSLKLGVGG
jgi:hypothetical protein